MQRLCEALLLHGVMAAACCLLCMKPRCPWSNRVQHCKHLEMCFMACSCVNAGPGSVAVQPVSYDVVPGDLTAQIMGGFTAAGTMAFSLANILLPEVYSPCCGSHSD